jgi:hypothetical protein
MLSTKCVIGGECFFLGTDLGTRAAGQKSPTGLYLSFYPTGGTVTDMKLEPTNWNTRLVAFKPPASMHDGVRYTVLIRDAQGKAASNRVDIQVAVMPNATKHPDFDNDGARSIAAGGLDCDDFNPQRAPGRTEVIDPNDLDEDCEPSTFGRVDADGDGAPSIAGCSVSITGSGLDRAPAWNCGTDCNDGNVAIKPGEMICNSQDTSLILLCTAQASWQVDPRTTPNDGCLRAYRCSDYVAGGRCVSQANGRGVCQAAP